MMTDLEAQWTGDASNWRSSIAVTRGRWTVRVQTGYMASGTAARYMRILEAFSRYAVANGVAGAGGASARLCQRFVTAPTRYDRPPTGSTGRVRLAAIRNAFEAWWRLAWSRRIQRWVCVSRES